MFALLLLTETSNDTREVRTFDTIMGLRTAAEVQRYPRDQHHFFFKTSRQNINVLQKNSMVSAKVGKTLASRQKLSTSRENIGEPEGKM